MNSLSSIILSSESMSDFSSSQSQWTEDNSAYRVQEAQTQDAAHRCAQLGIKVQNIVAGWIEKLNSFNYEKGIKKLSLEQLLRLTYDHIHMMTCISGKYDIFINLGIATNTAEAAKEKIEEQIQRASNVIDKIYEKINERQRFLSISNRLAKEEQAMEKLKEERVLRREKIRLLFQNMHKGQGRVRVLYRIRAKNEQELLLQEENLKRDEKDRVPQVIECESPFQLSLRRTKTQVQTSKKVYFHQKQNVDYCFDPSIEQDQIFHHLEYMVTSVFSEDKMKSVFSEDYKSEDNKKVDFCFFVYGQSGSGKTYSLMGPREDYHTYKILDESGIVQRMLKAIFQRFQQLKSEGLSLKIDFKEVFAPDQQTVHLVQSNISMKNNSKAQFSKLKGMCCRESSDFVKTYQQAIDIVAYEYSNRQTEERNLNKCSSRSHFIVALTIMQDKQKMGSITMIDLAANERLQSPANQPQPIETSKSQKNLPANTPQTKLEHNQAQTVFINSTLMNLGVCLRALKSNSFVAWRQCVFLSILEPFLSNSKVVTLITLSPKSEDQLSNWRSVDFGKKIKH